MFEDIDKVIELYVSGIGVDEISTITGLSVPDVMEIVENIDVVMGDQLTEDEIYKSYSVEREIVRLYKIGYDIKTIAEKVESTTQIVQFIVNRNCGGCLF